MAESEIRFEDGAAYERMMGTWSGLAGNVFVDWLAQPPGLRWIDVRGTLRWMTSVSPRSNSRGGGAA